MATVAGLPVCSVPTLLLRVALGRDLRVRRQGLEPAD